MNRITIPKGRLASDEEDAAARRRRELRENLLKGKKIVMDNTGNVNAPVNPANVIPKGKLAGDEEDAAARRRRELRENLLKGKKIVMDNTGNVNAPVNPANVIPKGKLAALTQWYDENPVLLEAEKTAMAKAFPYFQLDKLEDGRLYWYGALNIGVLGNNVWNVMAVYNNNHPEQIMGSSVRVYLVEPDIQEIIDGLGWAPHHLLRDSNNQLYLCTTEAGYVKTGDEVTSAASVIAWAVKWLLAFELVLTGDLTREEFDQPHGI